MLTDAVRPEGGCPPTVEVISPVGFDRGAGGRVVVAIPGAVE